ncbi:MAG TPA: histidine phosphatase family protein [Lacipirellulaceae bacterium]|jgi:phosphohistidine phosphatase
MFIYVCRHAWAGERGDPKWPDDSQRALTPEGVDRYKNVVQALAKRGFAPTQIATSPYVRCRQTAEIIAKYVDGEPPIDELQDLEPGSNLEPLLEWTRQHHDANVAWVGHSPDVEQLAAALIGDRVASVRFAKGAIAAIGFEGKVAAGSGELCWLATAKLLGV